MLQSSWPGVGVPLKNPKMPSGSHFIRSYVCSKGNYDFPAWSDSNAMKFKRK